MGVGNGSREWSREMGLQIGVAGWGRENKKLRGVCNGDPKESH